MSLCTSFPIDTSLCNRNPPNHAHTQAHILHDHICPSPRPDRHTASRPAIRASSLVYSPLTCVPLIVLEKPSSFPPAHSSASPLIPPSCSLSIHWLTLLLLLLPPPPPPSLLSSYVLSPSLISLASSWMALVDSSLSPFLSLYILWLYMCLFLPPVSALIFLSPPLHLSYCSHPLLISLLTSLSSMVLWLCIFQTIRALYYEPQSHIWLYNCVPMDLENTII